LHNPEQAHPADGKVANPAAPGHMQSPIYLEMVTLFMKSYLFKELDIFDPIFSKKIDLR
jgi:hypothetical protein